MLPYLARVPTPTQVPSTHHPWGKVAVIHQVVIALPEVDEIDLHLPEEGGCLLFSEVGMEERGWAVDEPLDLQLPLPHKTET